MVKVMSGFKMLWGVDEMSEGWDRVQLNVAKSALKKGLMGREGCFSPLTPAHGCFSACFSSEAERMNQTLSLSVTLCFMSRGMRWFSVLFSLRSFTWFAAEQHREMLPAIEIQT